MGGIKDFIKGGSPAEMIKKGVEGIMGGAEGIIDKFVTDPDKKLEAKLEFERISNESTKILLDDLKDARSTEVARANGNGAWITKNLNSLLALGVIGLSFILFGVLALVKVEVAQKDIIIYVLGALTSFVGQIIAYYFGSSKSSSDKNEQLKNIINKH